MLILRAAARSSLASAGSGLKAIIILAFMGPALDAFGPHKIIHWCIIGSAACDVARERRRPT